MPWDEVDEWVSHHQGTWEDKVTDDDLEDHLALHSQGYFDGSEFLIPWGKDMLTDEDDEGSGADEDDEDWEEVD